MCDGGRAHAEPDRVTDMPKLQIDGEEYEVRNRVTLCRCGRSQNKPFCDGRHVTSRFRAGEDEAPTDGR